MLHGWTLQTLYEVNYTRYKRSNISVSLAFLLEKMPKL